MLSQIYDIIDTHPKLTDIHISADDYIYIRVLWKLTKASEVLFGKEQVDDLIKEITEISKSDNFSNITELDASWQHDKYFFRANIYQKHWRTSVAIRKLNQNDINIYDVMNHKLADSIVKDLLQARWWLVLVTGTTGSGKSTTIAAMLNWINDNLSKHIITLEDPIEYIFENHKSLVSQRQIGKDTNDFSSWLRSILRQNPDVIMIGEIRDTETALAAINMAESGHLVFATLHTRNTSQTISRLASFANQNQKEELQLRLSMSLLGILCQQLIAKDNEQVAVFEYMYNNHAISNLIKKWEFNQIPNAIMTGKENAMTSMEDYQKLI